VLFAVGRVHVVGHSERCELGLFFGRKTPGQCKQFVALDATARFSISTVCIGSLLRVDGSNANLI
jgi:hypothetical protein